ncbi:hypothetical protein KCU62_g118, partial [Aureobasidium sp. EXF-3399]
MQRTKAKSTRSEAWFPGRKRKLYGSSRSCLVFRRCEIIRSRGHIRDILLSLINALTKHSGLLWVITDNGIDTIIKQLTDRNLSIHSPRNDLHAQSMCSVHHILGSKWYDRGTDRVCCGYPVAREVIQIKAAKPRVLAVFEPGSHDRYSRICSMNTDEGTPVKRLDRSARLKAVLLENRNQQFTSSSTSSRVAMVVPGCTVSQLKRTIKRLDLCERQVGDIITHVVTISISSTSTPTSYAVACANAQSDSSVLILRPPR